MSELKAKLNFFTKLKQSIKLIIKRKDNELLNNEIKNDDDKSINELQISLIEFLKLSEKLKGTENYVNNIEFINKELKRLINKLENDLKNDKIINKLNKLNENELLLASILSDQFICSNEQINQYNSFFSVLLNWNSIIHPISNCIMIELNEIINLPFFHPDIDKFKAEELLENKSEGTFLLRNSSHPKFNFSVSFRRHQKSLHARIERKNNQFSFDINGQDSQKFKSIIELFEKYKDSKLNLFDPILLKGLNRTEPLTLKQLSKYRIQSSCNYHNLNKLQLPLSLKEYLKKFNYCNNNLIK